MNKQTTIASMPLYTNLDRINKGLASMDIGAEDAIPPERLFALDQWHYHGTDAIQTAVEQLAITSTSHVLDIGSGIGGPARYLAYATGCHVTALELQPELHAIAIDLTRRCGLKDRVTHLCGDALSYRLPEAEFDAVVSWLAILHIPDRPRLLGRLARTLRTGGRCYLEDLCMRSPFTPADLQDLRTIVYGITVTDIKSYVDDLRSSGFVDITATDLTPDWAPYAATRLVAWRDGHAAYSRVHGEEAYAAQELFYRAIVRLYESGSLGGVRLVARVP